MVILGIDPGLANTGWGIVEERRGEVRCRAYGCIETSSGSDLAARLRRIADELTRRGRSLSPAGGGCGGYLFRRECPSRHHHPPMPAAPALVACSLCGGRGGGVHPYADQAGRCWHGAADKTQVTYMVRTLLHLNHDPKPDHAADALACAVCHAHLHRTRELSGGAYTQEKGNPYA